MVSKFIKRGTNKENVWKHGNMGTREQGPILEGNNIPKLYQKVMLYQEVERRKFERHETSI